MKDIRFEWNQDKAKSNLEKHGISFDENARIISDIMNSHAEERFVILGLSDRLRILVVCHCYQESDEIIRIISARKATRRETTAYGECLS